MSKTALLFAAFFLIFNIGHASPVINRQCRAGICDDRPECPRTSCTCIFPSKIDCAVYYQCVQGKPYQHQCSKGLLFNEVTLTCDYDYNVNCSKFI
ncbi:chitin-binding type-2 domain-containing protein [Caerostris darwini]|uniref:Chitin-binding type-2 domain-containing protein n=1 Tax=Caerostris darwini TaxID=1538125 RepID=A0AAV4V900_9ARAC|nr:chitin-binding type-2 domain-containing protein [Caerostris darwini]